MQPKVKKKQKKISKRKFWIKIINMISDFIEEEEEEKDMNKKKSRLKDLRTQMRK